MHQDHKFTTQKQGLGIARGSTMVEETLRTTIYLAPVNRADDRFFCNDQKYFGIVKHKFEVSDFVGSKANSQIY